MTDRIRLELPAGQRALLTEAPCDCPTEDCHQMSARLGTIALEAVSDNGTLCPLGMAAVLVLAAASLVNPANAASPTDREMLKVLASGVADVMEEVARGIRLRVQQ